MKHQDIDDNEIIDRYVLQKLSADERRAFQEHFLACEDCFDKVQMTARFVAGVRESSIAGALATSADGAQTVRAQAASRIAGLAQGWLKPAFWFAATAAVVLATALGWLLLNRTPDLRQQLERERLARQELERETEQRLEQAKSDLEKGRQQLEGERLERAKLADQLEELAHNKPAEATARLQANAPIVILEAQRDARVNNQLSLNETAKSATLWIEVEADKRFDHYNLQILNADQQVIATIAGAKPNAYGALAVGLPANLLQSGKYIVKLYGLKSHERTLLGDYDLRVRRL